MAQRHPDPSDYPGFFDPGYDSEPEPEPEHLAVCGDCSYVTPHHEVRRLWRKGRPYSYTCAECGAEHDPDAVLDDDTAECVRELLDARDNRIGSLVVRLASLTAAYAEAVARCGELETRETIPAPPSADLGVSS